MRVSRGTPTETFHQGLRVYPLSDVDAPPQMEFISLSEQAFNTIHANDVSFFDELDAVIQREPLGSSMMRFVGCSPPSGSARALRSRPTTVCVRY